MDDASSSSRVSRETHPAVEEMRAKERAIVVVVRSFVRSRVDMTTDRTVMRTVMRTVRPRAHGRSNAGRLYYGH